MENYGANKWVIFSLGLHLWESCISYILPYVYVLHPSQDLAMVIRDPEFLEAVKSPSLAQQQNEMR